MFTRFQRCEFIFFLLKNYSNSSTLEDFIKKRVLTWMHKCNFNNLEIHKKNEVYL